MSNFKPVKLEAEIKLLEGTEVLIKEVASIMDFPEKTPDLLFFSGVMVSTGTNANSAHFLGSELVKAHKTINNKPLDVEHEEEDIVGHIYSSKFFDQNGNLLNIEDIAVMSDASLDAMAMDVMIAGIIYKNRFPTLSEEVADGKWKLSMETYYQNYDVKVGNVIMTRQEAEALGIASDQVMGKMARLLKKGKEVANGEIARVLRGLLFSGCGVVKQPANPRSLILETAKQKGVSMEELTVELDGVEINKNDDEEVVESAALDSYDDRQQTSVGICVSYKKQVINSTIDDQDSEEVHTDWCTLFDTGCTSFSRGADHPDCLRRKVWTKTEAFVESTLAKDEVRKSIDENYKHLKSLLSKVKK